MSGFSDGGYIPGVVRITVKPVGPCVNDHPLYLIDGHIQHVIPSALIRSGHTGDILACQRTLEDEQERRGCV